MATVNSYTRNMPTPERTTLDEIVRTASALLETDGLQGVTMQAVAERVGVRAPSLYKRVHSRDRLIQLIAEDSLSELAERLEGIDDPVLLANTLRAFGHERPAAFQLVMSPGASTQIPSMEFGAAASGSILRVASELAGPDDALEAARTLTAWAVGFIGMELNGTFQLGGEVQAAWEFGVTRIVAAITRN